MSKAQQIPEQPNTFVIDIPGDYDEKEVEAWQKGFEAGRDFTLEFEGDEKE